MSTEVGRVVRDTVALGILLPLVALRVVGDAGAVATFDTGLPGSGPVLLLGLLLVTLLANLVAVPVRRGEQVEELTLLESAVIADVLLLPAHHALWLPAAAVVLSSVLTRRDLTKSLFNAGNLAASSAVLVLLVHLVAVPGAGLSWRTVVALLLGLGAFTVVNLTNLSRVLTAVHEIEARAVLTDGARLATLTLPAHLSIAGSAVLAASAAPALLPFCFLPAVALVFAFRARAQEVEERERTGRLLALSQALAAHRGADELLPTFLRLVRQAFDADLALIVLDGAAPRALRQHRDAGFDTGPADPDETALLSTSGGPPARAGCVVAPMSADGRRLGVVALVTRDRRASPTKNELLLLSPLAGLLAAALQAAEHVQHLTEATSKLQAVVDQSSDGILVLDAAGVVQLWSPALTTLVGCSEEQALGAAFGSLTGALAADGTPCDAFESGRALLTPERPQATVELTLLRTDGEQRVVRCAHAAVFEDGLLQRDVVIVHDVTRERQVERLKADFIATVSHELRTPVTPIKGYAELLRRRGEAMTVERRNECLAVISDRCDHLARLVEDLLLASRISASEGTQTTPVQLAVCDLVPLVRRAAGDFGDDGRRVLLELPAEPLPVRCDPVRVVQVLTNLIGNALKYSDADTPVQVLLSRCGETVEVQVRDRGRGIPADELERVFEKFHRVEDPLRMTTGGTGLGLYIARQLATAMGGGLRATSRLGVGSVFHFVLPAPSSELARIGGPPATADVGTPVRDRVAGPPAPRTGLG